MFSVHFLKHFFNSNFGSHLQKAARGCIFRISSTRTHLQEVAFFGSCLQENARKNWERLHFRIPCPRNCKRLHFFGFRLQENAVSSIFKNLHLQILSPRNACKHYTMHKFGSNMWKTKMQKFGSNMRKFFGSTNQDEQIRIQHRKIKKYIIKPDQHAKKRMRVRWMTPARRPLIWWPDIGTRLDPTTCVPGASLCAAGSGCHPPSLRRPPAPLGSLFDSDGQNDVLRERCLQGWADVQVQRIPIVWHHVHAPISKCPRTHEWPNQVVLATVQVLPIKKFSTSVESIDESSTGKYVHARAELVANN